MIEIRCTSCSTRYRLDERAIADERPTFKCSRCGHVFTANVLPSDLSAEAHGEAPSPTSEGNEGRSVGEEQGAEAPPTRKLDEVQEPLQTAADQVRASRTVVKHVPKPTPSDVQAAKPGETAARREAPEVLREDSVRHPGDTPDRENAGASPASPASDEPLKAGYPNSDSASISHNPTGEPPRDAGVGPARSGRESVQGDPIRLRSATSTEAEAQRQVPRAGSGRMEISGRHGFLWSDAQDDDLRFDDDLEPRVEDESDEGRLRHDLTQHDDDWSEGSAGSETARGRAPFIRVQEETTVQRPRHRVTPGWKSTSSGDGRIRADAMPDQRPPRTSAFLLLVFAAYLVGFGVLSLSLSNAPRLAVKLLRLIPGSAARPAVAMEPTIEFHGVQAAMRRLKDNHTALVIIGTVKNVGTETLKTIQLRASVRDRQGREVLTRTVYCGSPVQPGMVGEMTPHELDFFQKLGPSKSFALPPGLSAPFVIAFVEPPADRIASYSVVAIRTTAASEAGGTESSSQ